MTNIINKSIHTSPDRTGITQRKAWGEDKVKGKNISVLRGDAKRRMSLDKSVVIGQ